MKLFSNRRRPVHLGPFPLERLMRADVLPATDRPARPPRLGAPLRGLTGHMLSYLRLFEQVGDGAVAPKQAPLPDDPRALANELKSACYFLDASMVGVCAADSDAWYLRADDGARLAPYHKNALIVVVEQSRAVEAGNLAAGWLENAAADHATLRAGEIALVVAGYIRRMGFPARAHTRNESDVDAEALAERAGVVFRERGRAVCPFIGGNFALAVVTTDMPLAADRPIVPRRGLARVLSESAPHWFGLGGVDPGMDRSRRLRRPSHLSRYKMEKIARVERPTTLILDDEVPRVPKRAAFFERALRGDLGDKAQRERARFATKHPFANAMVPLMRAMVPLQDGPVADEVDSACDDPARNAKAIKSLSYFLGADLTGICRAKEYAWHSHREDGRPIEPAHANAIVLLIDQGFETMEGASGDDWISGAQSMRGYLRGAEIAGLMAAHIRALGFAARAHSNLDSDVNHIPLILWAGLGEMSRIGELVLNPFVGPRFKSAIVTTDMPLTEDLPVDFGLQDMCSKCMKCARECPCDAISWGNKVMFNGYEIWKPDAERCTRYRVTNPHGSACGRCMKTCPYNHEGLLVHNTFLWGAIKFPFLRKWIAKLDDKVGNGRRNPVKQWWHDLEMVDGVCVKPKGANKRELDLSKRLDRAKQKIAYYHADMMPPPNAQDIKVPVDRKQALAAASLLETPADALARRALGGAKPKHYNPTPPADLK